MAKHTTTYRSIAAALIASTLALSLVPAVSFAEEGEGAGIISVEAAVQTAESDVEAPAASKNLHYSIDFVEETLDVSYDLGHWSSLHIVVHIADEKLEFTNSAFDIQLAPFIDNPAWDRKVAIEGTAAFLGVLFPERFNATVTVPERGMTDAVDVRNADSTGHGAILLGAGQQWRASGGSDWITATEASEAIVEPGVYDVRNAAVPGERFATAPVQVEVGAYVPDKPDPGPDDPQPPEPPAPQKPSEVKTPEDAIMYVEKTLVVSNRDYWNIESEDYEDIEFDTTNEESVKEGVRALVADKIEQLNFEGLKHEIIDLTITKMPVDGTPEAPEGEDGSFDCQVAFVSDDARPADDDIATASVDGASAEATPNARTLHIIPAQVSAQSLGTDEDADDAALLSSSTMELTGVIAAKKWTTPVAPIEPDNPPHQGDDPDPGTTDQPGGDKPGDVTNPNPVPGTTDQNDSNKGDGNKPNENPSGSDPSDGSSSGTGNDDDEHPLVIRTPLPQTSDVLAAQQTTALRPIAALMVLDTSAQTAREVKIPTTGERNATAIGDHVLASTGAGVEVNDPRISTSVYSSGNPGWLAILGPYGIIVIVMAVLVGAAVVGFMVNQARTLPKDSD